jgi:hypothetical protein
MTMRWPEATTEPLSRLRVRTKAVVLVVDDATGRPPAIPPAMRLYQLGQGDPVEPSWRARVTVGGAVLFSGHDTVGLPRQQERYRLVVEGDASYRPERPAGYEFTVEPDPGGWPVRVLVRLLPGPGYTYPTRLPAVHGQVVRDGPEPRPAPDAVVVAAEGAAMTVTARCGADHQGRFSLGLPRLRDTRPMVMQAIATDGAVSPWQPIGLPELQRSVQLTV